uniref:Uncharacterized protein n=1 Tax=Romanomermis culicivorax TaxID=13658 RepID=A0A915JQU5_ROMCU
MVQRSTAANCSVQPRFKSIIKYCYTKSSIIFEDRADYGPSWNQHSNIYKPEFTYKSAKELQSFPFYGTVDIYSGGGYVVELIGPKTEVDDKLNEIKKMNWIDRRTRALILEFSAYNAFANLFVFGRISFEFPTESGVIAKAWFQPMNLLRYHTVNGQFLQFCEIVFYLYTLTFILKEIRNVRRQGFRKYIRQFWSLIEICIILLAIVISVVYVKIYGDTKQVLQIFEKSNGNEFTNLSSIGAWYQTYEILLGFLTFLAIFKFIKILRFNRHIATINATFELVRGKLLWFAVVFFLSFTAFCSGLYLSMSSTMEIYKSMGNTFQNTFEMLLGKYDFSKLRESDRILAPFFVFLFFVTTSFVLLDLCISILMESFKQVRKDAGNHADDYELWRFMQARFRNVLLGDRRAQVQSLDVDQQANDYSFYDKFDYKFNLIVAKIDRLVD